MLVVAGSFEVDPARRDEFIESRRETMAVSRGEEGCHEYVFAADPIDAGRVVLYERWESREDLAAHLSALRARRESGGMPPEVPAIRSEVLQYDISGSGPVGG